MPLSDSDHVEALRSRLQNRLAQIDSERMEVIEMIRVLSEAPKLLKRAPAVEPSKNLTPPATRTTQNRNVTELVRQYVDNFGRDKSIDIPALVKDYLVAENGVRGKYRSLYSAVCVILKKESQRDPPRLTYEKGVGFYKPKVFGQKLGQAPVSEAR